MINIGSDNYNMFKNMRKSERQLGNDEIKDILNSGEYGILATTGENNYSYAIPLNYVYWNNSIYFHCAFEGNKIDNINLNNKVCFCVVGKAEIIPNKFTTKYKSAVAFGKASSISDDNEKKKVLYGFIQKYSPDFKMEGSIYIDKAVSKTNIIKISIEHVTAKGRLK